MVNRMKGCEGTFFPGTLVEMSHFIFQPYLQVVGTYFLSLLQEELKGDRGVHATGQQHRHFVPSLILVEWKGLRLLQGRRAARGGRRKRPLGEKCRRRLLLDETEHVLHAVESAWREEQV